MALWSNTDEQTSAPKHTVDVVTGNTGIQSYQLTPVGTFGVDTAETAVTPAVTHAGWTLRTEGTGGRAGRVFHETLVAMGSMGPDTGEVQDDAEYPDAIITLTGPDDVTANAGDNVTLSVVTTTVPTGIDVDYQWFNAVGDVALTGETDDTLFIEDAQTANAGIYYVTATSGNVSTQSANATVTINE
jgi:hypothetical protein